MRNKKGYQLKDLMPIGLMIVVSVIAISIGANIVTNTGSNSWCATDHTWNATLSGCSTSTGVLNMSANNEAANVTFAGVTGLGTMGSWIPTIALVVAAAIVIGVLVYSFAMRN